MEKTTFGSCDPGNASWTICSNVTTLPVTVFGRALTMISYLPRGRDESLDAGLRQVDRSPGSIRRSSPPRISRNTAWPSRDISQGVEGRAADDRLAPPQLVVVQGEPEVAVGPERHEPLGAPCRGGRRSRPGGRLRSRPPGRMAKRLYSSTVLEPRRREDLASRWGRDRRWQPAESSGSRRSQRSGKSAPRGRPALPDRRADVFGVSSASVATLSLRSAPTPRRHRANHSGSFQFLLCRSRHRRKIDYDGFVKLAGRHNSGLLAVMVKVYEVVNIGVKRRTCQNLLVTACAAPARRSG